MHEAQNVPLCNFRACIHLARSAALRQNHARASLLCKLGRAAGRQQAQQATVEGALRCQRVGAACSPPGVRKVSPGCQDLRASSWMEDGSVLDALEQSEGTITLVPDNKSHSQGIRVHMHHRPSVNHGSCHTHSAAQLLRLRCQVSACVAAAAKGPMDLMHAGTQS